MRGGLLGNTQIIANLVIDVVAVRGYGGDDWQRFLVNCGLYLLSSASTAEGVFD
jgi:hypothetical protein